jgi:L-fuconolactonase
VLVQSQPSAKDTAWLLDLSEQTTFVLGVVGWVDIGQLDAPLRIERLASHTKLRGLRPMLQNLSDDEWILSDDVAPALDAMIALDLRFDALIYSRHLPVIDELARRYPRLQIVVDHAAKPNIASGSFEPWASHLTALAQRPNVCCKLSGLPTEAGEHWNVEQLRPYVDHVRSAFGAERIMWGSDWPVLNLAGNYRQWWEITHALLPASELDAVLSKTARQFYKL